MFQGAPLRGRPLLIWLVCKCREMMSTLPWQIVTKKLWPIYQPLFIASLVVRYLKYEDKGVAQQYTSFSQYMPPNVVQSLLLGHYLVQLETNAIPLLPANLSLVTYTMVAPPAPVVATTT